MPPEVNWRKSQKQNDREHHEKATFFHIAAFWNDNCFALVLKKRLLHFLCYLFVQKNVQLKLSEAAVRICSLK